VRISIVGTGYVGLVTGACLAELGHDVTCVDLDQAKVDMISAGVSPIHEAGLDAILADNIGRRLSATTDLAAAVLSTDITFVAVGTPVVDAVIDLTAVMRAARSIGEAMAEKAAYHVVVLKSTVVPGTTDGPFLAALEETSGLRAGDDFGVAANPEFLTEGEAVRDFMEPDRIVLGATDEQAMRMLLRLYDVYAASVPRVCSTPRTAEMIKYASNALLATLISFSNEIGNLSAATGGIDIVDVMHGVHLSNYLMRSLEEDSAAAPARIASFLEAGCGFGGSCLPKDVRSLIAEGDRRGRPMRTLRAVIETNDAQPRELLQIVDRVSGGVRGRSVTVLGLAFKPDTDDVRESPSIPVVKGLVDSGAKVTVHDPVVAQLPESLALDAVSLTSDLEASLGEAEIVVLVTRWEDYRELSSVLERLGSSPYVIDGRRMLAKHEFERYAGIGLG
jgi:UDPglucose 6-dehydrogenase